MPQIKKLYLYIILLFTYSFLFALEENTNNKDSVDQDWYSTVIEKLQKEEYNISYSENIKSYQSPNRNNNLRFVYNQNGFSVKPRVTEISLDNDFNIPHIEAKKENIKKIKDWNAEFTVLGYGRGNKIENTFTGTDIIVENNTAYIEDENMRIDYINNKEGMRQNFIIQNKPKEQKGHLRLKFKIETKQRVVVGANALIIRDDETEFMKYSSLKIWDADGKKLRGWFNSAENKINSEIKNIQIVVNDKDAVYPITIDPLSTTPNWSVESNQSGANYGWSVATAGDVNGDGYSDIIVGAKNYTDTFLEDGKVFVYYGSATGFLTTADWSAIGEEGNAHFGYSVATAGDVNADGYSDIIIGAPDQDDLSNTSSVGKAYVYHGSPTGLSQTADWTKFFLHELAAFGNSVSTAGDVNGDGYSDVIIGQYKKDYNNVSEVFFDDGAAYVFHGSPSGLSTNADWSFEQDQLQENFGVSVATAGDVNGDGYSDVIVGASGSSGGNVARVFFGSTTGLSTTISWGVSNSDGGVDGRFAYVVATAGDVNGDGYSDVIVGNYQADNGATEIHEGKVYLYYGSSTGPSGFPDWTAEGNQAGAFFGYSVATAGDINGDGYADVIIGAIDDGTNARKGKIYVYNGSENGLPATANWTADGANNDDYLGSSVATAGDVNGDGFSDIIAGAYFYSNSEGQEGAAFVYKGSAGGLSNTNNWNTESNQANELYGYSVSTAGDVNGDGYSDVIIGAHGNNANTGKCYIYFGGTSLNTTANVTMTGEVAINYFGSSVSTAGDVNGDGYSDVIVGAFGNNSFTGKSYIYFGGSSMNDIADVTMTGEATNDDFGWSVSTAGDVNGDGYSDVIVGARKNNNSNGKSYIFFGSPTIGGIITAITADVTMTGEVANNYFGSSVSTAGDVNGDGYSDVIVGAFGNTFNRGKSYIYFGSSSMNNIADATMIGNFHEDKFGSSVSTAGDVNGDGYSDVIVGAFLAKNGGVIEGRAYVYHGSLSGLSTVPDWTAESNQENAYYGLSVSTAGDVNGDGYSDIIVGASYYDNASYSDGGRVFVYLGSQTGLSTTPKWEKGMSQTGAQLGHSVSTAGDVNGDGYSDVIVGVPFFDNGETDEGGALVFYGNEGGGLKARVRQYKPGTTDVIAAGGLSETDGEVRFRTGGKSPFGRADGRMVYEYKSSGQPFSSGNNKITNSVENSGVGSFTDLGSNSLTGKALTEDVTGIPTNSSYKWRARVEYNLVNNPYQKYGPWRYFNNFAAKIADGFKPMSVGIAPILVDIKIFLEGPYNNTTTNMNASLTVPFDSPYPEDPVHVEPIPNNNIVDWALVELRDKNDSSVIISSRSAFIKKSGVIVDLDGSSSLQFSKPIGDYYIVVKHRNHLGVMSSSAVGL